MASHFAIATSVSPASTRTRKIGPDVTRRTEQGRTASGGAISVAARFAITVFPHSLESVCARRAVLAQFARGIAPADEGVAGGLLGDEGESLMFQIKHKKTRAVLVQIDTDTLAGRKMAGSRLRGADLNGVDLSGADLVNSDLRDADLQHANLRGALLNGAYLNGANLVHADLSGADLTDAKLHHAELQEARLIKANLRYAQLQEAILCGADLSMADLSMADLRADFHDAKLIRADMRASDLTGANLRGADLQEANLKGAKLATAQFAGAKTGGMIDAKGNRLAMNGASPVKKVPVPWWKFWAATSH